MEEKQAFARRMRRAVALAEKALPVIRAKGLGKVTAEELAEAMEISRATFFRHFATKEEALLFAVLGEAAQFAPGLEGEADDLRGAPLWPVLRRAMSAFDKRAALPDYRARVQLALGMPDIGMNMRLSRLPQLDNLVAGLVLRGIAPETARHFVVAAVAVTDRCLADWARAEAGDLSEALDSAFAQLARGY